MTRKPGNSAKGILLWGLLTIVFRYAGVGDKKAKVLAQHYPTPRHMFEALRQCKADAEIIGRNVEDACVAMLSAVPVTLSCKVGPVAAKGVYKGLFQPGWHA
jgi:hypothetical protein